MEEMPLHRQCLTVPKAMLRDLRSCWPQIGTPARMTILSASTRMTMLSSQLGKWMYETNLTNTSSRSSTRSVYLWNCALRFNFFEVTWVHTRCKMNNSAFFCSRSMTFFFYFWLSSLTMLSCSVTLPLFVNYDFLHPESSLFAWRILIDLCVRL